MKNKAGRRVKSRYGRVWRLTTVCLPRTQGNNMSAEAFGASTCQSKTVGTGEWSTYSAGKESFSSIFCGCSILSEKGTQYLREYAIATHERLIRTMEQ